MIGKSTRRVVLAARPKGRPTPADFRLEEYEIPSPGDGELLLQVNYLSLDPYMRGRMEDAKSYAAPVKLGDVMTGETVAMVIASNRADYSVGDTVFAYAG